MAECEPPDIASLLMERKAVMRELGSERLPAAITAFIDAEFALARANIAEAVPAGGGAREEAEAFFLATVYRPAPPQSR